MILTILITVLKNYKDEIVSSCALISICLAFWGLTTWRRQLIGNARYVIAKDFLKALYNAEMVIGAVRCPMIFLHEYSEDQGLSEFEKMRYIYGNRMGRLDEAFFKLENLNLDLKIELGSNFNDTISVLRNLKIDLEISIMSYVNNYRDQNIDKRSEEYFKIFSVVSYPSLDDEFGLKISKAVKGIEIKLRPFINSGLLIKIKRIKIKK